MAINTEEVIKDTELLIRGKVRALVIRKLSMWDSKASLSGIIDEETENFMKIIRPALYRIEKKKMSKDWFQDIVDFHEQIVQDNFPKQPYIPNPELRELRGTLIIEEISETLNAMDKDDLAKIADGIADSIVVLLGTAVTYGIDIRPIWDEVHKSNMLKKGGKLREDGKLLKPKGWKPPEIERIIKEQQNAKS